MRTTLLCMAAVLVGCATTPYQPNSKSDVWEDKRAEQFVGRLVSVAPYQTGCDDLAYRNLGPLKVGVEGCGKRVVYVRTASDWIMESVLHMESNELVAGE